jgi:hypothetical protein
MMSNLAVQEKTAGQLAAAPISGAAIAKLAAAENATSSVGGAA